MTTMNPTAAFDAAARAKAVLGSPLPRRMAGPGMLRRPSNFGDGRDLHPVWFGPTGLLTTNSQGEIAPVTPPLLAGIIGSSESRSYRLLAPVDRRARTAMISVLAKAGDKFAAYHREVALLATLPVCSTVVTVADVLARKFWLPTGLDPRDIAAWSQALGFDHTDPFAVRAVVASTWTDQWPLHKVRDGLIRDTWNAEDRLLRACRGLSPRMQAVAFGASGVIGESWGALERTDPTLRDRYQAGGEVVRLDGLTTEDRTIAGRFTGLCKLGPGRKVLFSTDDGRLGILALDALASRPGTTEMAAVLSMAGKQGSYRGEPTAARMGVDLAREVADAGGSIWLTSPAFTMVPEATETRWTSMRLADEAPRVVRDMPLAVAVAGAPTA